MFNFEALVCNFYMVIHHQKFRAFAWQSERFSSSQKVQCIQIEATAARVQPRFQVI